MFSQLVLFILVVLAIALLVVAAVQIIIFYTLKMKIKNAHALVCKRRDIFGRGRLLS